MGLEGLGFLYVKEELQGEVLRPMQFGDRQYDDIQYHNFPGSPAGSADVTWELKPGAARYEIGTFPNCGRSSAHHPFPWERVPKQAERKRSEVEFHIAEVFCR